MTVQDTREALITASILIGNANAKLTHLWREKLISAIYDNLTPLIQDDSQFTDVAPYLFGSDFVKQAKEYFDQVGALKSTLSEVEPYDKRPLFVKAPLGDGIGQRKGRKTPQSKADVPTGNEQPQEDVIPIPRLNSTHTILSLKMPCQNTNVTQSAIAAMGTIITLTIQASPAGRLAHFQSNWEKVTKDGWVLNTVKGYEIEFSLKPHRTQKPYPAQLNRTNRSWYAKRSKT